MEKFKDKYYGSYTSFANYTESLVVRTSTKIDLTQNVGKQFDAMQEEARLGLQIEMPITKDWATITMYLALLRLVAKVSGRTMVGAPLCRNEERIKLFTQYAADLIIVNNIF